MSPRDRSPVRTPSPRQPSRKDHWNQLSPYNLTLLQLEQTTGSSGRRGTGPPTEPGFSQGFSPFCYRWTFGSDLWLAYLGTLHFQWYHRLDCRYYLNWTEMDDAITKCNNEIWTEKWVLNLVILHYWHTILLFWYCAVALLQFVLLKALHK